MNERVCATALGGLRSLHMQETKRAAVVRCTDTEQDESTHKRRIRALHAAPLRLHRRRGTAAVSCPLPDCRPHDALIGRRVGGSQV
jgi:hypothetical protein